MNLDVFFPGRYLQQFNTKSFSPVRINKQWRWNDPEINILLENAAKSLGYLNAFAELFPRFDVYLPVFCHKEVIASCKITGLQTSIEELFLQEEDILAERIDDWKEAQDYFNALDFGVSSLNESSLNIEFIKETYKILFNTRSGGLKNNVNFRKRLNKKNETSDQKTAFIPTKSGKIKKLMVDFEDFFNNNEISIPLLIKIGISHYQFTTIQPFPDGNGRLGRLLVILALIKYGFLKKPILFVSDYFLRNLDDYYESLTLVRKTGRLGEWVKFFLQSLIVTADKCIRIFKDIFSLQQDLSKHLLTCGLKMSSALKFLDLIFKMPIISTKEVTRILELTPTAADMLMENFIRLKILEKYSGFKENRNFIFSHYMRLFDN